MKRPWYAQRRFLRRLERLWAKLEQGVSLLTGQAFNPLYHLGTLAVILLVVLTVTGIYLTIFYRPGAERAYETVVAISNTFVGNLMRSIHRYAADALVIVALLHAFKMLVGDRFWGARWLAWVSGWLILLLVFVIGVMGYWLVWDDRAQWLTEFSVNLVGGQVALAFYQPGAVERNFAFFVIILFLHVFLGVLLLGGLLVHVIRLSRPALFPPRWLTLQAVLVLGALALLRPAASGLPANFSRVVAQAEVDWLYLGFLPLASRYGMRGVVLGTAIAVGAVLALPWLAKGRSAAPIRITEHLCTGCALCALKCPYDAIEMVPRSDDASGFKVVAVVTESLCTGCGLCIGTCATTGVDLAPLPTQAVLDALTSHVREAQEPVVLFTCQRQAVLGTLPAEWVPPLTNGNALPPPVTTATWSHNGTDVPVVVCAFPCAGMLNPEWLRSLLSLDARAAVVVSCPTDDCSYREGPAWLAENVRLRRRLLEQPVFWVTTPPGNREALTRVLSQAAEAEVPPPAERLPRDAFERKAIWRQLRPPVRSLAAGLALLALAFFAGILPERTTATGFPPQAVVRVVMAHTPKLKVPADSEAAKLQTKLPEGVSATQILGGERYPVQLRLVVDGEIRLERTYEPSGLRREGSVTVVEQLRLPPGSHHVELWMMDDGQTWRQMVGRRVEVASYEVVTLAFDEEAGEFVVYNPLASQMQR